MRTILLALAVAVVQLPAQVPESVAKITHTMPSGTITLAEFQNMGQKPITAIVIEKPAVVPGEMTTMVSKDFPGQPLGHNGRDTLHVWDNTPVTEMHIAAVIFEDGTTMGYSKPYPKSPDIVTSIFLRRKGEAEAWVRWRNFVSSLAGKDDKAAVAEFIKAVNATPVVHEFHGNYEDIAMGENNVLSEVQTQAANAEGILARGEHDDAWVREEMFTKYIGWRAQVSAKFAERKTAQ
jgi:hypothetical protein